MVALARLSLCVAAAVALTFASSASAAFNTGYYTHGGCPGTSANRIDPINFFFYNWGTYDRSLSQMRTHAGWYDQGGSSQSFVDHSTNCNTMIAQAASGGITSSRFHIRLHPIDYDAAYGWTTVGDAHHEDLVWYCGHAVDQNGTNGSGFDQGRRQLRMAMEAGGHAWTSTYWGNTQSFKQCDGGYASSDGYTVLVNTHQINH